MWHISKRNRMHILRLKKKRYEHLDILLGDHSLKRDKDFRYLVRFHGLVTASICTSKMIDNIWISCYK
jgi:hypothetical protein